MRDVADANGSGLQGRRQETDVARSEGDTTADAPSVGRAEGQPTAEGEQGGSDVAFGGDTDWGKYEPAIRRWEAIIGRQAPSPTEFGPRGNVRLSPRFAEWMMGIPPGWVTGLGFSRKDMFRFIGNGVVPLQAALAIRGLIDEEGNSRARWGLAA